MLEALHLKNVGPAEELAIALRPRMNFLVGDNGLGKSFLLDVAWWVLTRTWARRSVVPHAPPAVPSISFRYSKSTSGPFEYQSTFNRESELWSVKAVTRAKDLPPEKLPDLWTRALDDMLAAYGRICAYVAVYIERVTAATIDHWIPKSRDPRLAYEWSNYRLGCSKMNGRKSVRVDLVDPFEVRDGDFALELVGFQVLPGVEPDHPSFAALTATIDAFKLNDYECCALRGEYFAAYRDGDLSYLEARAPFVAREVRRQGRLRVGDAGRRWRF